MTKQNDTVTVKFYLAVSVNGDTRLHEGSAGEAVGALWDECASDGSIYAYAVELTVPIPKTTDVSVAVSDLNDKPIKIVVSN